jgi:hypothetical protein
MDEKPVLEQMTDMVADATHATKEAACGFTDQAHLIHDFGTIVGGTPADFFGAARRWNFRGGDAVPSLADSYNPFIV